MGLNPANSNNSESRNQRGAVRSITTGVVTSSPGHTEGDKVRHHVEVSPDFTEQSYPAEVLTTHNGDVTVPTEGEEVFLGMRPDERMVVLGVRYNREDTIPEYESGLRRIGHNPTDSFIELQPDGTVLVENDNGTTVELQPDGDVVIDGGTNNPITDLQLQKDADGHVTDIFPERSSNVYLP